MKKGMIGASILLLASSAVLYFAFPRRVSGLAPIPGEAFLNGRPYPAAKAFMAAGGLIVVHIDENDKRSTYVIERTGNYYMLEKDEFVNAMLGRHPRFPQAFAPGGEPWEIKNKPKKTSSTFEIELMGKDILSFKADAPWVRDY